MRISSEWLRDFVQLPPADELAHVFEMAGLGVENRQTSIQNDGENHEIFALEVTSNRGDCLSAIGLAREIAAMTDKKFRAPQVTFDETVETSSATIEIENGDDCPRYMARLLEIQLGESPAWMQQRLIDCGMRPINVVVDVTNYVMLETGQPLHAFDADRVLDEKSERHIVVRRARDGEKLVTLDDTERELSPEVLVIADFEKPIAIAGVMGGRDSEVTPTTTRVLLESANFDASRVRRGGRTLNIQTEARRRFERNIDANSCKRALDRATLLLIEYSLARVAGATVDIYSKPSASIELQLRVARANAILGLKLSTQNISDSLARLCFKVEAESEGLLHVTVPTWRRDIAREVDLIEEVARVWGYDKIPTTLPRGVNAMAGRSLSQRIEEKAKSALLRCGLSEVVTLSMTNEAAMTRAGLAKEKAVELRNPLSEDFTQLRTSLVPSLLEVLGKNAPGGARIFELGRFYLPKEGEAQPNECRRLGLAMTSPQTPRAHWQKGADVVDFFTLKTVVETALWELGAPRVNFRQATRAPFHPGRCAVLSIDSQDIGVMGEVHPDTSTRYDISGRAYLAIFEFDALTRHIDLLKPYSPLPRFPAIERDLALVLANDVPASLIENTLKNNGGELLQSAQVFDIYTGAPIPDGQKSVSVALRFQSAERTLTDEEVEAAMNNLRQSATRELGANMR